jgi:hypothetical protein
MTVIVTGCPNCEPLLREGPLTPVEPEHFTYDSPVRGVLLDGSYGTGVLDCWTGTPGRAILLKLDDEGKAQSCPCTPLYVHESWENVEGQLIPIYTRPAYWLRYLETYDEVKVEMLITA